MSRPIAYEGQKHTIVFAVCSNGRSPGEEFYDSLDDRFKARLNVLFKRLGDEGKITNPEQFKKVDDTAFHAFKAYQIRMPCFFLPNKLVVITHGFRKKTDRIPPQELKRARRIKGEDGARYLH